ncbi:MAG TPA: PAS domain S-box protein, partial [Daejeonella sp.]|nr:PAS domain S-box protein [Daejeonella sp.]
YTSEEVVGKSPEILQGPKSDFNELKRLSKALDKWETCEISTINYKKSGEEFWINFTVSPIANEKGYYTHWIAIERDITEKKNRELEQNLLSRISRIFNEEKGLSDAAQKLCSAIAEFGEFDFVELWIPNLENTFIQLISYKDCSTAATEFYRLTEHVKHFEIGDGMPGLVWKTKKTITWTSKETTTIFIRTQEAKKAGISSLIAAPLLFNDAVVGVLKLGSQKEITQLNKYLKILPRLELFIGSEINRKSLETNLNHLFEAIPDIISLADFQGRFLKMNKAGCELLGYSEEEILFHNFNEFVHPDDTEITVREIQKLKEGKTSLNFENRFITKKGEILWLSWIGVSDIQEGVIYSSAKNVTKERKLSELNRQASSLARIGSWEIDVVNAKLFWSDMLHNIHETDPVSFMPNLENGINFYRKDFQEIVRKSVDSCISEGTSFNYEAAIITAKNKERWIHAIGYSEFVDGKCVRVFGSFQDISQFKETEAKLKYITDDLPGVVFQYMIYPDGTDALHTVSKACEKIWMLTQEECYQDNNLIW